MLAFMHALALADDLAAQEIQGRATDESTEGPIAFAEVALLDGERLPVVAAVADAEGRFVLKVPASGEYYVAMRRIGYVAMESPLIAVKEGTTYEVELAARPEPVHLRGLEVSVTNEVAVNWLRREFGGHPNAMRGFRLIQGMRLEEAKSKSRYNTGMLRWLYIPVSHGMRVCVLVLFDKCGQLYVDGRWTPNEHIDRIDMESIKAVVTVRAGAARVYLFTSDFDWKRHWNSPGQCSQPATSSTVGPTVPFGAATD